MLVDFLSMFSSSQELSGASTDSEVLDIKKAGISEGVGYIYVRAEGALTGLGTVTLAGSTDNKTFADIVTYPFTDLTDGGGVNMPIPQGLPQYLKLVYKAAAGAEGAAGTMSGKVTAGVTLRPESPRGKRIGDFAANPNHAV